VQKASLHKVLIFHVCPQSKMKRLFRGSSSGQSTNGTSASIVKASSLQHEHDRLAHNSTLVYTAPTQLPPSSLGKGPSGTLNIRLSTDRCPGFIPSCMTIELEYKIPSGTQCDYHPNPGHPYDLTHRTAYLPNNEQGRELLTRFKFAWHYGYIFNIGRSQATGLENQVTWTTVPHKTSLQGGPFGFPDNKYFDKANQELSKLGIPDADTCLRLLLQVMPHLQPQQRPPPTAPLAPQPTVPLAPPQPQQILPLAVPDLKTLLPSSIVASQVFMPHLQPQQRPPPTAPLAPQPMAPLALPQPQQQILPLAVPDLNTILPSSTVVSQAVVQNETLIYTAPKSLASNTSLSNVLRSPLSTALNDECAICLDLLSKEPSIQISACQHSFHFACIQDCLNHQPKCPVCRKPIGEPQGKSPSGKMSINVSKHDCPGFGQQCKSICILYDIPSGKQASYHEHPGQRYSGTKRVAFLPNNPEGRDLLQRLKYAWLHGLVFRVGTSLTTGQSNQVTWTSIHHKTSLSGSVHGFPDTNYIANCNASLDALHVPPPEQC